MKTLRRLHLTVLQLSIAVGLAVFTSSAFGQPQSITGDGGATRGPGKPITVPVTIRVKEETELQNIDLSIHEDGEPQTIAWNGVARVKEEVFKNGTSVSFALYKRVGERNVARSFVIYRDDIPRFDEFLAAVRDRLPESVEWRRETVHE